MNIYTLLPKDWMGYNRKLDKNAINHLIIVYSSSIGDEYISNSKKLEYIEHQI